MNMSQITEILVKGQEVRMPSLSPTMTEGTIIKWHKKEGEKIDPGDVICEIQTDKAVVAYEIEDEAVLAKILGKIAYLVSSKLNLCLQCRRM